MSLVGVLTGWVGRVRAPASAAREAAGGARCVVEAQRERSVSHRLADRDRSGGDLPWQGEGVAEPLDGRGRHPEDSRAVSRIRCGQDERLGRRGWGGTIGIRFRAAASWCMAAATVFSRSVRAARAASHSLWPTIGGRATVINRHRAARREPSGRTRATAADRRRRGCSPVRGKRRGTRRRSGPSRCCR